MILTMRTLIRDIVQKSGESVELSGWVHARRDHGNLIFIDLRDRSGLAQIVFLPDNNELHKQAEELRPEWVVKIIGKVNNRPEKMVNLDLETGTVEVQAASLEILNKAATPPLSIDGDGYDIGEEVRMKYRYLDLRRSRLNKNIRRRARIGKFVRDFLIAEDFTEIETPILTKTTPEGARDFLVPARLQPGKFYALPQSPQQYKQLLMVAGFERYFQFARCFRDEDPRADRAYGEFTQVDIEMSFVKQEDILNLTEAMFTKMVKEIFPEKRISKTPWPRIPHKVAQEKYGTDKPDLRKNKNDADELAFAWIVDFPLFTEQSEEDYFHGSGSAKFAPSHHMFTSPHLDDIPLLDTAPEKVRGLQHDLVLNGYEIGGGSIRIHKPEIQSKIFDLIGFSDEQKKQFTHLLTAFKFGVPPHGGIAPGFDRMILALTGEKNIREVIAFPKTGDGRDLMMDAPSEATPAQLNELKIKIQEADE